MGHPQSPRSGKIFYVLPYQVSINAMADRLVYAFPDADGHSNMIDNHNVSVLHASSDLAYLQDAMDDGLPIDRAVKVARASKDASRKIYSPVKVTTVYQLLGIFFGRKFFEVGLLEFLVILDEIHAYDGHTLGLILVLLQYLQKLGARVLIMTATLPTALRVWLRDAASIAESHMLALDEDDALLKEVRRQVILLQHDTQDLVVVGRIKAEIRLRLDFTEAGAIHEVKESRGGQRATLFQLLYYLYYLKHQKGIETTGVIDYPRLRRPQEVELTPDLEREVEAALNGVRQVRELPHPHPSRRPCPSAKSAPTRSCAGSRLVHWDGLECSHALELPLMNQ